MITFVALLTVTQLLVWQRHRAVRAKEFNQLLLELDDTKDHLNIVLAHNASSVKTIVTLVKYDQSLAWFNDVAKDLMEMNESIDIVEYVDTNFNIARVYPLKGNEVILGYNVMTDPRRRAETQQALTDRRIRFAGPYDLLTGEKGIATRLPIYDEGKFLGGAVTITKLSTILKRMPELNNKSGVYVYQLTKVNPVTHKKESFFKGYNAADDWQVSRYNRRGDWILHVGYVKGYITHYTIYLLAVFSVLFSGLGAMFVYMKTYEAAKLEHAVRIKTRDLGERMKELSAIYQVNEILKDERQSIGIALSRVVKIIPSGFQYPESCAARIVIGKEEYTSGDCSRKGYHMQAPMIFNDNSEGYLEVSYPDTMNLEDEGPFMKDERALLNALAEAIQIYYNKKLHRDRVARSEASLRTTIEAMPAGVLLADATGEVLALNSRMRVIYSSVALKSSDVGDNFMDSVNSERKEEVKAHFDRVIQDMEPVEYDVKYGTEENPVYLNISMIPVISNASAIGVCITVLDITDRKKVEVEHRRIISDLMQHMSAMVEFARVMNERVGVPVSAIISAAEQAEKSQNGVQKEAISNIHRLAKEVDNLIKEMGETLKAKKP
ncbi:CHASE domain-containing protein [Polluticoccus soli]|uniref:CHASE domain-containing protein n=1 Tax=Polluticoccus soli TaxID=3034150 RepID=UPI0023E19E36|nr:CHASE domain-containing protein [Flavipsychrobacter sp. JY13-12]